MNRPWEDYPTLDHLASRELREAMESRRRHRQVRYMLFAIKTSLDKGETPTDPLPGFMDFWLNEKPQYAMTPRPGSTGLAKISVDPRLADLPVSMLGGFEAFASKWDVDADLVVYLRWSSIWQEWNATLARVVPTLGE